MSHTDSSTDAILAKLAAMQATLDTQQAAIADLQEENARLHAALSAEPATPSGIAPAAHDEDLEAAEEVEATAQRRPGLTSRRSLLRGAAAATAAASVGAVALGAAQPAHAAPLADGGNLIIGQINSETSTTSITSTDSTLPALFQATTTATDYHNAAIYGVSQAGGSGVIGRDQSSGAYSYGSGVYGYSLNMTNGVGVRGETESGGVGVSGEVLDGSGTGTGVAGSTALGFGVVGFSASGWAVVGESNRGYDFVANGTGIIGVNVQSYVGAPTTGQFTIGDCIRDANGDLWLCMAGNGSGVGTWAKVMTLAPGGAGGGSIAYLSKPIRLLDTRPGQPAANQPGVPYATNSMHSIQIAGVNYAGVQVPARCAGAIVNLTVLNASSGNYVALVPSGAGFSGTSNLDVAPGQIVSNLANVGLSSGGALEIIMGNGGGADVILDLFAIVS